MSGLSRTPGKRVWVHSPPRVRIPPVPPKIQPQTIRFGAFFCLSHAKVAMPITEKFKYQLTGDEA